MTIKVDKQMREKIDARKIDIKETRYIYESPDGKNVYRRPIENKYCDVSGIKLDKSKEIDYISIYQKLVLIEDKLDNLIERFDGSQNKKI